MTITWRSTTTEMAYAALFELVSQAYKFKTATRDLRKWSEIETGNGNLPALFQEQTTPDFESAANIPTIRTLQADLAVIVDASDTNIVPAIALNNAVDAIIAALAPNPADDYRQTLGGLVYDCKLLDKGQFNEAVNSNPRSYATLSVQITITGNEGVQDDTGQP